MVHCRRLLLAYVVHDEMRLRLLRKCIDDSTLLCVSTRVDTLGTCIISVLQRIDLRTGNAVYFSNEYKTKYHTYTLSMENHNQGIET